jgi:hypothetical protein
LRARECDGAGRCLRIRRRAREVPSGQLSREGAATRAGEDNADSSTATIAAGRALNGNGFIQGPVHAADGSLVVNDRVSAITYRDVMPRVMRRVALEVAQCLAYYGARPENGGRYPTPAPACRQDSSDAAIAWGDGSAVLFRPRAGHALRAHPRSER